MMMRIKMTSYKNKKAPKLSTPSNKEGKQIIINNRCLALLEALRSSWFPNEPKPMAIEDFIYTLACALYYNNIQRK